jgi:hypothetical protein
MLEWIIDNKEWVFSGVGAVILTTVLGFLFKKKNGARINQEMGTGIKSNKGKIVFKDNKQEAGDSNEGLEGK